MMTAPQPHFGPRLIAGTTGSLRRALLFEPAPSIADAPPLPGEPSPVYERASAQFGVLCATLKYFGCKVEVAKPLPNDPLGAAAADLAVCFEDGAVLARPSSLMRRPQLAVVEREFERIDVPIAGQVVAPGLFDGSDVLLIGDCAFVGAGLRGNALGREGFKQIASAHRWRVVEVTLQAGFPLCAVAGAVASDTIVLAPNCVDAGAFASAGFKTIGVELGEELGAGVLCIGERHVVADLRYPSVVAALRKNGITVEAIDLYDFGRAGITPSMLTIPLKRLAP